MSQPAPYDRSFDFYAWQTSHPQTPLPADKIQTEYDNIAAVIDHVLNRIAILQRDDLQLANRSVGYDQLKVEVEIGFEPPSTWAPGVAYSKRATVIKDAIFYRCEVAHTSSNFATELAAGKWTLLADLTSPAGPSAYEVAVEEGFVGTVSEWLASLVGNDGGDGLIVEIQAGDNITVDSTDPARPIVSATGGGGGAVSSVNGKTGTVVLAANDIGNTPAGNVAATTVQGAINELDGEKAAVTAIREKLTANQTYYVRADGNDSNNGLADSSGGAFLTPQKAFDTTCTIDLNGFTVTISIGSGSFEGITFNKAWVGGNITIVGAGAANTTIASTNGLAAFYVSAPAPGVIRIDSMKITNSAGGAIRLDAAARFLCGSGLEFGTCVASHILAAAPGAFLSMLANYTISGGSIYHLNAQFGAYIRATGITVTLTGTPAVSIAYANASNMGAMLCSGSFSGSATGPRYTALQGGGINTGGGGASFFPGSSAGTATSPGWYL